MKPPPRLHEAGQSMFLTLEASPLIARDTKTRIAR
jgi:hypothetical protein